MRLKGELVDFTDERKAQVALDAYTRGQQARRYSLDTLARFTDPALRGLLAGRSSYQEGL